MTKWIEYSNREVEAGAVIFAAGAEGGMVDLPDRRPVVLEPDDAWRWMEQETPVEEAAPLRDHDRCRQMTSLVEGGQGCKLG